MTLCRVAYKDAYIYRYNIAQTIGGGGGGWIPLSPPLGSAIVCTLISTILLHVRRNGDIVFSPNEPGTDPLTPLSIREAFLFTLPLISR